MYMILTIWVMGRRIEVWKYVPNRPADEHVRDYVRHVDWKAEMEELDRTAFGYRPGEDARPLPEETERVLKAPPEDVDHLDRMLGSESDMDPAMYAYWNGPYC